MTLLPWCSILHACARLVAVRHSSGREDMVLVVMGAVRVLPSVVIVVVTSAMVGVVGVVASAMVAVMVVAVVGVVVVVSVVDEFIDVVVAADAAVIVLKYSSVVTVTEILHSSYGNVSLKWTHSQSNLSKKSYKFKTVYKIYS